jgi:hypothetical protein
MNKQLFGEFVNSCDTLRIYRENSLVFHSKKDKLSPLMEFLSTNQDTNNGLVVFDKIFGNAAALLAIMAGCNEAYSPLGSQIAIDTFTKYSVKYYFRDIVPYILNDTTQTMCPMEAESINRTPHEFYQLLQVT